MSERKANQTGDAATGDGDRSLKYGVLGFAVVEALVLISFVIHTIFFR